MPIEKKGNVVWQSFKRASMLYMVEMLVVLYGLIRPFLLILPFPLLEIQ